MVYCGLASNRSACLSKVENMHSFDGKFQWKMYVRAGDVVRRAWHERERVLRAFRCLVRNAKNARLVRFHRYEVWIQQFHRESLCCFGLRRNAADSKNVMDSVNERESFLCPCVVMKTVGMPCSGKVLSRVARASVSRKHN